MKAMKHTAIMRRQPRHRVGGAFAYVMAYMTLAAMLLSLSGSTLHSILQTSETDRKMFREIHVAEDTAAELRGDSRRCVSSKLTGNDLLVEFPDAAQAVWTVDKHQLLREFNQSGKLQSRSQLRFQPGTQLTFRQETERLVVLRITAPPLAYLPTASPRSEGVRAFIDIALATPRPDSTP